MKSKVCNRIECFAWTPPNRYRNSCTALEEVPEFGECPFFKSKGQAKDEKEAMRIRAEYDEEYRQRLEEYGIRFKKRGRSNG